MVKIVQNKATLDCFGTNHTNLKYTKCLLKLSAVPILLRHGHGRKLGISTIAE